MGAMLPAGRRGPDGTAVPVSNWRTQIAWTGVRRTLAIAAVLGLFALLTQWIVWLSRPLDVADRFVGPPRSDYELDRFTLTALNQQGTPSFTATAPRMTRHPWIGSLDIVQPELVLIDKSGQRWEANAARGWVDAEARELHLLDGAKIARVASGTTQPLTLVSDVLVVNPDEDRLSSDAAIEVISPGSILRAVGLDANLAEDRILLRSAVRANYAPAVE